MTPKRKNTSRKSSDSSPVSSVADKFLAQLEQEIESRSGEQWIEEPLTWAEFFSSKDHMDFPPLSDKQQEVCQAVLTTDPKETFNPAVRQNSIAVVLAGKGGGKDQLAAMILDYLVHVLLCLRDPYEFLRGSRVAGEPIDILLVAPRGRTSEKVTFEKLKQRVLNWKWLAKKYKIRVSGREIKAVDREGVDDRTVEIGANSIIFPKNIRVFALNSSNESAEGFNTLAFICTEFAAFVNSDDRPNADKIFRTLYSSANTRFPGKFLGILISFPRYKGDAMMQKYDEAQTTPRWWGMKCASWEFNPTLRMEDYMTELNSEDPKVRQDAEAKYLCNPGEKETAFIEHPDRILASISDRAPVAEVEPYEVELNGAKMLRMRVTKFNMPRQADVRKYVARVDLGKKRDRSSMCLGHLEGDRVVIDLIVHWIPDPIRKLVVDIDDPANMILDLRRRLCNIIYVTYDQWQSDSSINRLNRAGITSSQFPLGSAEYGLMLNCLYSGAASLYKFPALTDPKHGELFHLTMDKETGKVDHEEGWHNDVSESVCGVVAMLKGTRRNVREITSDMRNVPENLHEMSTHIWSDGDLSEDIYGPDSDDDVYPGEGVSVRL